MFKRFQKNLIGRDFVVGDIHGCFTKLEDALSNIQFNPSCDRLFSVGDLIDRGDESHLVRDWLSKPWFHAVRGNHDDLAIRYVRMGDLFSGYYLKCGGGWFMALPEEEQLAIAEALESLPYALQIETDAGLIGVVHAESPYDQWDQLVQELESEMSDTEAKSITEWLTWSRERTTSGYCGEVKGLHSLIVGHWPVDAIKQLGNVIYIDTKGWKPAGEFTLFKVQG